MNTSISILYGVIQGLTEFLPVSSSGHLALLPHFLKFKDPGVFFDLLMHVGTAGSVLVYFWRDWLELIKSVNREVLNPKTTHQKAQLIQNLAMAMAMTVLTVLLLKPLAEGLGRHPVTMAVNLALFGLVLWAVDRWRPKAKKIKGDRSSRYAALTIGLLQGVAIFPGVSRSGITITAARGFGVNRQESMRFSFLLSLPLIFAGFFYKLLELIRGPETSFPIFEGVVGVGVAFIAGLSAIHLCMTLLDRFGFGLFAIYRVLLAIAVFSTL